MTLQAVSSFIAGDWLPPDSAARPIENAVTGAVMAEAGRGVLEAARLLSYATEVGGPALRKLSFHDRARMLKALAQSLNTQKQALYDISFATGATQSDHLIDIDGGIGTLFVFASKGRREMPDGKVYADGPPEQLSRDGSFLGQHICTPLQGVALHINAFNFPVWGMLEKLAPALLAGVPVIVKPATATCYVTEAAVKMILASGILPQGALQMVAGGLGDLLDHLSCQDVASFTGSAATARKIRQTPALLDHSVRFIAEQDSLNASVLGPDAGPNTPEFDLFLTEIQRELTTKAGQKCTAIRRILVPEDYVAPVIQGLGERLKQTVVGDPQVEGTTMGALVSNAQKQDVLAKLALLETEATRAIGAPYDMRLNGSGLHNGAFLPPMVLHCESPDTAQHVHDTEAFGPVATVMGYRDLDHATRLLNRGGGSLVASVITHDADVAREVAMAAGAYHGRIYINNRDSMNSATGHGSPLPHMVHGGPGRAGGGEEMGGIRGVLHYMQRTAIQGSPDMIQAITGTWVPGAAELPTPVHPFRKSFDALQIGETLHTEPRTITEADIQHFAEFTGDTFYAHMDDAAAARNPFFPGKVAHGYLLLSFAAGLFVDPDEGPVLANTGLESLRFMQPVQAGDSLCVALTVKAKTPRNADYGEVRWHVTLRNQDAARVAEYELLTMNAFATAP